MRYVYESDGQHLFDFVLKGFLFFLKNLFRLFIYSPFLIAAYLISKLFLNRNDHAILWLTMVLIFSFALFIAFAYLKKTMIRLKEHRNLYWIPIFIFCAAFSCILPAWIIFEPARFFFMRIANAANAGLMALAISISFGYFIYSRNGFLR